MRNLWIFISKYNAFFLFLIFEVTSLVIYVKNNSFQRAEFINSANKVTGGLYARADEFYSYLSLKEVNDSLARENAHLRNTLKSSFYADTVTKHKVTDTVYKQQYDYIVARVINNSVNHNNNYLTINKGSKQGIAKGMGVICNKGIVGKVVFVSDHFSLVQSLLHKDSQFSAMLADNKEIGHVEWSDDMDPHKGILKDVSNNARPRVGEWVVTSGYSLFPEGVPIGKISSLRTKGGGYSLNMEITLSVDFSKLEYVNVVDNKFSKEQEALEARQKKDE
ncbi:rod shape-determining protein MreC [Mucilaginibacter gotjawali]|uniref:Cell shape-determining protein MreC n=2 Tax=Mucilaginibacter gotjawali TaxID=1550579 RepID=A0A120MYV4_9SPHI|nr:rod shape-determining protein MreC [Mucilaginibacter gotjawali]MBB3058645.1 rod shape-determining protein MreC [Mucilaginibacter gotjawali]BAU55886.1 Cell shape-determining protein MreC precursor [Mucilaginibacter gotjawali]